MSQIREFDVALSFAGENREYVDQVAKLLQDSGINVFYDLFEEEKLWGKNLYDYLSDAYMNKALYTIMFISEYYANKLWTNHEREAMQARAFRDNKEYILPARFDATPIPGILSTTGYISLKNRTPEQFVELIQEKLISSKNEIFSSKAKFVSSKKIITSDSEFSKQEKLFEDDELISAKEIDYKILQSLLKNQKWQLADQETCNIMDQILEQKWSIDSLTKFPLRDLLTIDKLWTNYSQGKFGFSSQKQIFLNCGGKLNGRCPDEFICKRFCEEVGWISKRSPESFWEKFNYFWDTNKYQVKDISVGYFFNQPKGHLPVAQKKLVLGKVKNYGGTSRSYYKYRWVDGVNIFGVSIIAKRLEEY